MWRLLTQLQEAQDWQTAATAIMIQDPQRMDTYDRSPKMRERNQERFQSEAVNKSPPAPDFYMAFSALAIPKG